MGSAPATLLSKSMCVPSTAAPAISSVAVHLLLQRIVASGAAMAAAVTMAGGAQASRRFKLGDGSHDLGRNLSMVAVARWRELKHPGRGLWHR